jgi:hypothetical protein
MGTRSSIIIFQDGKAKGYYNQYDGYPMGGVGESVVKELRNIDRAKGWDTFKANCKKVKLIIEGSRPSKAVQKKYEANGFYNEKVSNRSTEDWYCLLRECQNEGYIKEIMADRVWHMVDGTNFVHSSLFCEYAYVIDLDKMVIEFYKGFQKKPQLGNRFGITIDDGYYPCAKVGQIALQGISKDKLAFKVMEELYEKASQEREQEN